MRSVFKQVAILIIAVMINVTANAQEKGDIAVGGKFEIGSGDGLTNIGLGGKFQYNVIKPLRLEGSATYFFPKKWRAEGSVMSSKISMWDFSANAQYLFFLSDKFVLYPLAGLSLCGAETKTRNTNNGSWYNSSTSKAGLNIGGGIDVKITDNLVFNAELKYKAVSDWDRTLVSVGLMYKL
ncbi:MAG: porin family protein [Prevotellaceae bacterium]|jgi:opacity protein-like surface antigen|nr:porin family protein [Prevotellaceae bacterium]